MLANARSECPWSMRCRIPVAPCVLGVRLCCWWCGRWVDGSIVDPERTVCVLRGWVILHTDGGSVCMAGMGMGMGVDVGTGARAGFVRFVCALAEPRSGDDAFRPARARRRKTDGKRAEVGGHTGWTCANE